LPGRIPGPPRSAKVCSWASGAVSVGAVSVGAVSTGFDPVGAAGSVDGDAGIGVVSAGAVGAGSVVGEDMAADT